MSFEQSQTLCSSVIARFLRKRTLGWRHVVDRLVPPTQPRKKFFDECVAVMRESGRYIPLFNDKHLSYSWAHALEMYNTSRRNGFGLMAGSSIVLAHRLPHLGDDIDAGKHTLLIAFATQLLHVCMRAPCAFYIAGSRLDVDVVMNVSICRQGNDHRCACDPWWSYGKVRKIIRSLSVFHGVDCVECSLSERQFHSATKRAKFPVSLAAMIFTAVSCFKALLRTVCALQ